MRFGTQKLGRFISGRLQGSKGVQKYDKYMEETPMARKLLTGVDIAGATLGGAALLGGGSVGAGLGKIGSAAKSSVGGVKSLLTGKANVGGFTEGAGKALKVARENKDLIALGGKGIQSMLPDAASDAAMMNAETARKRYELEQEETEEERRRKENIAKLLIPMYQQLYASRG